MTYEITEAEGNYELTANGLEIWVGTTYAECKAKLASLQRVANPPKSQKTFMVVASRFTKDRDGWTGREELPQFEMLAWTEAEVLRRCDELFPDYALANGITVYHDYAAVEV